MTKAVFCAIAVIFTLAGAASAQYDKNGTRNQQDRSVSPQPTPNGNSQTDPNGTTPNNYGAPGNKNDHTRQKGGGN